MNKGEIDNITRKKKKDNCKCTGDLIRPGGSTENTEKRRMRKRIQERELKLWVI